MNYELQQQIINEGRKELSKYLRSKDEQGDIVGFNEDLTSRILAEGDAKELKELLIFWQENGRKITQEQIEIFSYYEKLRKQVHQENEIALKNRKAEAPERTGEEQALGCYLEQIEPQVRQAVLSLNRKGFKTQGSGFAGENIQKIYCQDNQFQKLNFSESFLAEMTKRGVDLKVEFKSITFRLNKKLSLDEIKSIWLEIEKLIEPKDRLLT